MTRIAKGKQSGELWDRIILENGIVGFVFQNYVTEVNDIEVQKINLGLANTTLQKGETVSLDIGIVPTNASDKNLTFTSSNQNVVTVDSSGKLFAVSKGTAVITAKAKNNVTASIDITVYSKVTGLNLKEENLSLEIGETYKITPIVLPEDANNKNVDFNSTNEKVASINESGVITALTEGESTIKVVTKEGNFEKEVALTVIPKLEIEFEKPLKVNGNQITGWNEKTTVEKALEKIKTSYRLEFVNNNEEILSNNEYIGTESKIRVYDEDTLLREYSIILYGDVNGDGKINSIDLLVLQRHILGIDEFSGLFLKAGNTGATGQMPSSIDLLKIQRHILGIEEINQSVTISNISNIVENKEGKVILSANKENVEKNEEFEVSLNANNLKVSAFTAKIYFDSSKIELTSNDENIKKNENSIIYTWYDENGGENLKENEKLLNLSFKSKEDGISNFSLEGEFYNEKQDLVSPIIKTEEITIGKVQEELEEDENSNLVQSNDKENANLAALRLNIEGITPDFDKNLQEYYITVDNSVNNIDITAIAENRNSKINITGNKNLKEGNNTIIIKVISENNNKTKEYKIYVAKTNNKEAANTNLETLAIENSTLSPEFISSITNYSANVSNTTQNLNILAIPENQNANVKIEGNKNLKEGNNNVTITVYAEDNRILKKYEINVYKKNEKEEKEEVDLNSNTEENTEVQTVATIIDNSKEIKEVEKENFKKVTKNGLIILSGSVLVLVVIGIVVIRIKKKGGK